MENTITKQVKLINPMGLHARAAATFAQKASGFKCEVMIRKDDTEINGKSIMGILMLALPVDEHFEIITKGEDAQTAMDELCKLVENGFGEL